MDEEKKQKRSWLQRYSTDALFYSMLVTLWSGAWPVAATPNAASLAYLIW